MANYKHQVSDEEFERLNEIRNRDNKSSAEILSHLAYNQQDAKYNLSILHLGIMMQILSTTLDIKQNEIKKLFNTASSEARNRKMEAIVKELNEKINLRYGFDSKTEIIPCLYTYKNEGHFVCCKTKFLRLLHKEDYDEIEILDNL